MGANWNVATRVGARGVSGASSASPVAASVRVTRASVVRSSVMRPQPSTALRVVMTAPSAAT